MRLGYASTSLMVLFIVHMFMSSVVYAVPTLQLYIEESSYDAASESWVYNKDSTFNLWVLGDVGAYRTIYDVFLVAAYSAEETGTITFTPTTTVGLPSPGDSSMPSAPTYYTSGSGTIPKTGDGSALSDHGEYGEGTDWIQYDIGDFDLTDSRIGDYTQGRCPNDPLCEYKDLGQINVYEVLVSGYSQVHFDAFDHIASGNRAKFTIFPQYKYVFAPYSHDANANIVTAPEPNTLLLLGSGLIGIGILARRKIRK